MNTSDDIPAWLASKWTPRVAAGAWALVFAYIVWVTCGPVLVRFMP